MNIYIAGKVTARERLRLERQKLQDMGHDCWSTWIDGKDQYPTSSIHTPIAQGDLGEVLSCDLLILDTIDVSETGGREFEAGAAFANQSRFWIVGPLRNVFHNLADKRFNSWEEVINELRA